MPDKDQIYIFNNAELSLIKNTFAENEPLIYAIRKVFLQFPLTDDDKKLIKTHVNDAVFNVLKKRILPDIGAEFPLGQIPSLLTTLTKELQVKNVEEMALQFSAKQLEIDYLAQQFEVLRGNEPVEPIILTDLGKITNNNEETYICMTAYLFLLGYIDPMLGMIKVIAGNKDETLEQLNTRMKRDSNK